MSKDVVQAKDLRDTEIDSQRFIRLLSKRQQASEEKKELEATLAELNEEIKSWMLDAGEKAVVADDWRVTVVQSTQSTISKERLLELGVSAKIITKATKTTPKEYIQVTEAK